MAFIFISYRRDDSRNTAGRIQSDLKREFGSENVFFDQYNIPSGIDFRVYLKQAVSDCEFLLVIIGPDWLNITDENGNRRIDSPNDYVHIEIQSALEQNKIVIPVLVEGASIPKDYELPEPLQDLSFRNYQLIRDDPDYPNDLERLIERLETNATGDLFSKESDIPSRVRQIGLLSAVSLIVIVGLGIWFLQLMGNTPSSDQTATPASGAVISTESSATNMPPTETRTPEPAATVTSQPTATSTITPSPKQTSTPVVERFSATNVVNLVEAGLSPLIGHTDNVRVVRYTADGSKIISSGSDNTINIWSAETGELLQSMETDDTVIALAVSSDGQTLVSGGSNVITVWDLNTYDVDATLEYHTNTVTNVIFNHDDTVLAAASRDGDVSLWSTNGWNIRRIIEDAHDFAWDVAFDESGNSLFTSGFDGYIRMWNANSAQMIREQLIDENLRIYDIDYHADDDQKILAFGAGDARVRTWNIQNNEIVVFPRMRDAVLDVDFNSTGDLILAGDRSGEFTIYDVREGDDLVNFDYRVLYRLPTDVAVIDSVRFSPDGQQLITSSRGDNTVRVFTLSD